RRIVAGLRALGWSVETRELDASFPRPTPLALAGATRVLAALPDRAMVVIDGLALGAMPDQIEHESSRLCIIALVHLPLAAEVGLDADAAAHVHRSEQRALTSSAMVVVTGRATMAAVERYGVERARIALVEPGTDAAPIGHGSVDRSLQLLCVATVNRGKGHDILFRALSPVARPAWRLTCAGSLTRDPVTVERLRLQLRSGDLEKRVTLTGEVDAVTLNALYDGADLFVLPTLHETYGMAVAEALARGVPIVSTTTGAIAELVGDDAGILVDPGDERAFARALAGVMIDPVQRMRLAEGARRARARLPAWEEA